MAARFITLLKKHRQQMPKLLLIGAVLAIIAIGAMYLPFTRARQLAGVQLDSSWSRQEAGMAEKNMEKKNQLVKRLYLGTPREELIADLKSLHYRDFSGGPCPTMIQPPYDDPNDKSFSGPAALAISWCSDSQGNVSSITAVILLDD